MAMGRARVGAKKVIGAGGSHSLVTSGEIGEIWSFGDGGRGRLGHGGEGDEAVPRLIEALNHVVVKQVAAGMYHSIVLTRGGDVFTWGYGYYGQLGHGNTDDQHVPKRVEGLTNVTDIAAGGYHDLAVREGGAVYTWGYNRQGQLGLGHGQGFTRKLPTEVPGVNEVVAVAAGSCHSFVLSRNGTVMTCGTNYSGQLGLGDTDERDTFTVVAGLCGVVDIDAGQNHTIAVTVEGGLYTWGTGQAMGHGEDEYTQCVVPTKVTGGGMDDAVVVAQVAAGDNHSMALTATGELWTWGDGESGQLGHGGKENLAVPRAVGGIEGAVMGIAGGHEHSLVTTAEGRVLAFGSNGYIQEEDSDGEELDEPVFAVDGRLGLGAVVEEAMIPTAVDGVVVGREGEEGKEGKEGKE
jgi:alpha-tubulin suppressor-like RCC1 family protein